MKGKVKPEYYKVYRENLYLGTGDFSDDTVIFRDNFSYMISVGFPREVIINENSQKFCHFYFFYMFIVTFTKNITRNIHRHKTTLFFHTHFYTTQHNTCMSQKQ